MAIFAVQSMMGAGAHLQLQINDLYIKILCFFSLLNVVKVNNSQSAI